MPGLYSLSFGCVYFGYYFIINFDTGKVFNNCRICEPFILVGSAASASGGAGSPPHF